MLHSRPAILTETNIRGRRPMNVLLFVFSVLIASFPIFIAVWIDRPYFAAVFRIDSYKVALREILFLSFAVSSFAILESVNANHGGKITRWWEHVTVIVIVFVFIVVMAFTMLRYGRIAANSVDQLRSEDNAQVWLSWISAGFSGTAAALLKGMGG